MIENMTLFWVGFIIFIISMLLIDLFVFNRKAHVVTVKEAVKYSIFWISLAAIFNVLVFYTMGSEKALEFTTGYTIEQTLSVDNLFVFILVFAYFCTPRPMACTRCCSGAIIGALVFRGLFIAAGSRADGTVRLDGLHLRRLPDIHRREDGLLQKEKKVDPDKNLVIRIVPPLHAGDRGLPWGQVLRPVKGALDGNAALPGHCSSWSPTDMVFALDSIPAVLAITTDPFIVYTSNAFAILGLRSMYFALASSLHAFRYLKYGLAAILAFVGEDAGVGVGGDPSLGLPGSDRCGPGRDHQPVPPQEQGQDHLPRARGVIRSATIVS